MYLGIIFLNILLFTFAWSLPSETKVKDNSPIPEVTTQKIPAAATVKNLNKEQVESTNNVETKKPPTKKRDVPEVLADKSDYLDDDIYGGRSTDDYENIQALRSYLGSTRNSGVDADRYRANDYRYYDEEARRKRTAVFDNMFNKPDSYYAQESQLTPEDMIALAAYRQQQRLYKGFPYGRWNDIKNSIEVPDLELESDNGYNDQPENFFDRLYDQRYQNWANLPRSGKFIENRKRRSYLGNSKLRVPIYRRAIL